MINIRENFKDEEFMKELINGSSYDVLKKIKEYINSITCDFVVENKIGDNLNRGEDVIISGPVIIGDNVTLEPRCYIRPYTIIGSNSVIGFNSEIGNSIIFPNSNVGSFCSIRNSIIGENAIIRSGFMTKIKTLDDGMEIGLILKDNSIVTSNNNAIIETDSMCNIQKVFKK